ncbi:MAG: DNA repair protein RadA [Planctomycetota bacterium]|jgi:DNA repair protein RadA/Sms|nr:DNA repair protein RadA [Planctomycetota bacterium]
MAKTKTQFVCQQCGFVTPNWSGRCPQCREWNALAEEIPVAAKTAGSKSARGGQAACPITAVTAEHTARLPTGIVELDRILGGGLVRGAAILIGGEPGVGKSTLLMQVANWLAQTGLTILYVTAEESAAQLRLRAERLNALNDRLLIFAENNLTEIVKTLDAARADVVILDSIQMVYWDALGSTPGSIGQVRECAAALVAQAKRSNTPLFLVGHVTKDGAIAGPKVLEHLVDVVLQFEGERFHAARILRAVKNRYGAVNELGVFEMTGAGLAPIADPSQLFLSGRGENSSGAVTTATLEGSRPFLLEAQALVVPGFPGNAKRQMSGVDRQRAQMLLAVLEKRADLTLYDKDVFLNVAGGAELSEPGGDLAVALAVASSLREVVFPRETIVIGEVGLGGEIRPVHQPDARLAEAERLGFKRALLPQGNKLTDKHKIAVERVGKIDEALQVLQVQS